MGIDVSRPSRTYTEFYLPADTFRRCSPERCWCRGHHHNRRSNYMYVERGSDGREQYYDPMSYIGPMMMGGGWPGAWKSPQDWTTRDYDRLGDIMTEWFTRQRGRQTGPWTNPAPWTTSQEYGMSSPMGSPGGRRPYGTPYAPNMANVMGRVEELAEEYKTHLRDLNDQLYGSLEERRDERWKQRQFKLWQEFQNMAMNGGMAGMSGMPSMNMQMPGMMNQNAGMPAMPGMMNQNPGMASMTGMPGMMNSGMGMGMGNMMPQQLGAMRGMPDMGAGLGGMGMNGMMPGGAMGQMGGFGGDMFGGGGGGGSFGRKRPRPFGRGRLGLEDEIDDDFGGGFGGGGRGLFGRRGRRDDDGIFGGGYDGGPGPRGPMPPRGRPPRPDGGLGGAGGFFDDFDDMSPRPGLRNTVPIMRSGPGYPMPASRPDITVTPASDSPPIPRPTFSSRPPSPGPMGGGLGPQAFPSAGAIPVDPYRTGPGPPLHPPGSIPFANQPPGPMGGHPSSLQRRNSVDVGEPMARPREEEERRGEAQRGAPPGRRDI